MKALLSHQYRSFALSILFLALVLIPLGAAAAPTSNPATYPLDKCIVSGETLGEMGKVIIKEYDGREVRFCCKMCVSDFEKNQASFLKKLDDTIVETQLPSYPMTDCLVNNKRLGTEVSEPINHVEGNRLVRLWSNSCKEDLAADPAKFIAKLDAAVVQAQIEGYPAETCPISGQKLGAMGDPFNYVFAGRLVRFCCAGCINQFNENPTSAMAAVYSDETTNKPDQSAHSGHKH